MNKKSNIIISLGGSIIVPQDVNSTYLKRFSKTIIQLTQTHQFVIFTGGGNTARAYQVAAKRIQPKLDNAGLDWIGIRASIINAELLKQIFGHYADENIITDPRVKLRWSKAIHIGAGWKPGRSTDYDAIRLAVENSIDTVINLSNIDYVYTRDPRTYATAEKITHSTWRDFRALIGNSWNPGLNAPFDPIAAKLAEKHNITVHILNGTKLANVKRAIQGQTFVGTTIVNQ